MSILKFLKAVWMYFKETKGNRSQLTPLSPWHTVTPRNTRAHSKWKISTPCGNNKTTNHFERNMVVIVFCMVIVEWEWEWEWTCFEKHLRGDLISPVTLCLPKTFTLCLLFGQKAAFRTLFLSQVIDGLDWSCCNSSGSLELRYLLIKIHKILFNNLLLFDPNDTEFHNAFFLAWFTLLKKKEEKVSEEELMYSFDLKGWVPFHSARLNHSTLIPFFKQKPSTVVQRE